MEGERDEKERGKKEDRKKRKGMRKMCNNRHGRKGDEGTREGEWREGKERKTEMGD